MRDVTWIGAWQRGGSDADTTIQFPFRMAADSERIYVLDAAARRVVALRAVDGAVAWISGAEGSGPGEFRDPSAIAVAGKEVIVADPLNARLLVLEAATGAPRATVPAEDISAVVSLCPLPNGDVLLHTLGAPEPIVRLDRRGRIVERVPFPWRDLTQRPGIAMQGHLAVLPGGRCVLALGTGRGFSIFDGRRFGPPVRYVEYFDVPGVVVERTSEGSGTSQRLIERRVAATGVFATDSEIAVPFEGRTADMSRIVDLYSARTGAYRGTLRLGEPVAALIRAGPFWVALEMAGGRVLAGRIAERPANRARTATASKG